MGDHGIGFGKPKIDLDELRAFKDKVVGKLTGGLAGMAKQRKVTRRRRATASSSSPHELEVETKDGTKIVRFDHCDHRRRLAGGEAARLPVGRQARDGFDRRAGARRRARRSCWSSAAASSAWRWRPCTTRSAAR